MAESQVRVGRHLENRHRNALEKMNKKESRKYELTSTSKYYKEKSDRAITF